MSVSTLPAESVSANLQNPEKARTQFRRFLEMIKFEHTLFALPFAYTGSLLGGRGALPLRQFLLVTAAMVTARTAAMGLNRLIDREQDALNPRTADRALPRGTISTRTVWTVVVVSLLAFAAASAGLNRLCLILSPLAIAILWTYSYLKRFTWLCHFGLGLVLACAPVGGFLAVTGRFAAAPLALGAAMIFWLAGFDTLYGCQDAEFDARFGLHSIPQRFGIKKALWMSAFFHVITFVLLAAVGLLSHLGWPYAVGLFAVAVLLIYEHAVITPADLTRINLAFFHANAIISLVIFVSTWVCFRMGP